MERDEKDPEERGRRVSRRGLLLGAVASGGLVAGGAAGVGGAYAAVHASSQAGSDEIDLSSSYPFYGTGEQAGISTPQQRYSVFMTFALTSTLASDLQVLLARWSASIAQLMAGHTIGQVDPGRPDGVGDDTGEALDLAPASLTVTVGLGPGVFSEDRGLDRHRPALLRDLKALPSDALDPALTGGDLSLQACADDPQVAYHAIRDLARVARDTGTASTLWTVIGFGRASAGKGQVTPRNLLGFKDGTRNLKETADFDRFVWVDDGPAWQRRGTYQVVRKIQMHIENWDTDPTSDQNRVIGRSKVDGAPLTGRAEFDTPDFAATAHGAPVIDPHAHIRLAAHENNGGLKILRRGYNYTDGINQYGTLDAGLLFLSYQSDPAHFETLQTKLGSSDALNEYISHIGSGIFFVPPAPRPGHYLAEAIFA